MVAGTGVRLTSYEDCRDGYRSMGLRQALYDDGVTLMSDVIVNLHGDAHRARRRLENRLFRRDVFVRWEREVVPAAIRDALRPFVSAGRADLVPLSRRAMMTIAAAIAGVDRPEGTDEEFDALYEVMTRLSRASIVIHATGDKQAIKDDGLAALAEFDERFFTPSMQRRQALLRDADTPTDLLVTCPDVLATLLLNQDRLDLPRETVLREVAYFPWVGSHSTSNALAHTMEHIFTWLEQHPEDRAALESDPELVQRFSHESLRLHPPSPEALRHSLTDVTLGSGRTIPADTAVTIDVVAANRDPEVFGPTAQEFDPHRDLPEGVSLWGLAFGSGFHACLGQELAGGLAGEAGGADGAVLRGSIATMASVLLQHGARLDPDDPPALDTQTVRKHYGRFPVLLSPPG